MSDKLWATEPNEKVKIRLGTEGISANDPITVCTLFKDTVHKFADRPALKYKDPSDPQSPGWKTLNWADYYNESRRFAKSLISLGFAPHRCINIIGFNSVEWFISEMGTVLAGGIAAGIYSTNNPEACKYISFHSEAEVVILDGLTQLNKYTQIVGDLPNIKALVVYGMNNTQTFPDCPVPIYLFDDFLNLGKDVDEKVLEDRIISQEPGNCFCLIYTSGTTGPPKAVMISHDNVTWTTRALLETFQDFNFDKNSRSISYLPLSHIAAQILDIFGPMLIGSCIYFAQPDALKGSIATTLKEVRPTFFFGVPRVWEKIYEKMQAIGRSVKGTKKKISTWAKQKGTEHSNMLQFGGGGGVPCGYSIADKIVFSKVKENLGLDQAMGCFTSAAPISLEVLNYFASLDLPIYELFGQSECTGPHTVNIKSAWMIGTVGRPMLGTESKLERDSGELCYRGRHIFMGYMKNPEKTMEAIDPEGWLHSGDVATFDENNCPGVPPPSGFMKITGRIKEIIITAGGENIPPVPIEEEFKKELPCLSNCMVVGDKRKVQCLILFNFFILEMLYFPSI